MHLRPIAHLENRRQKCKKAHTRRKAYTFFLYFTTDLQRKPNRRFFNEPNFKNPFCTSLFAVVQRSTYSHTHTHTLLNIKPARKISMLASFPRLSFAIRTVPPLMANHNFFISFLTPSHLVFLSICSV